MGYKGRHRQTSGFLAAIQVFLAVVGAPMSPAVFAISMYCLIHGAWLIGAGLLVLVCVIAVNFLKIFDVI